MKKRFICVLVILGLVLCAPAAGAVVGDALTDAAAREYVVDKGLMSETADGFDPERAVTRAVVLQVLYNREGRPGETQAGRPWFADASVWAAENELSAVLQRDGPIYAAELRSMLTRYCLLAGIDSSAVLAELDSYDLQPGQSLTRIRLARLLYLLDSAASYCREEVVEIPVPEQDGIPAHTVPGTLCIPTRFKNGTLPAVVMLHGTGCDRDETAKCFQLMASMMAEKGIVTLRIDFMGSGDSEASCTDYNYTSASLDAKAAADYLAALDYVDPDRIAVLGRSQGGTNALLAAAKYPDTFHAVLSWSGALDLKPLAKDFDRAYAIARADGVYQASPDHKPLGERWFREVAETDVLSVVEDLQVPVLAINGNKDTLVAPNNAIRISYAAPRGTLYVVMGATHNYGVSSTDLSRFFEAVEQSIDFLDKNLGPLPASEGEG